MIRYFNKEYQVIIGRPYIITQNSFSPVRDQFERLVAFEDFVSTSDPNSIVITQHNMTFNIDKTLSGSQNVSTIEFYNLSSRHLEYLDKVQGIKPFIEINAGWVGSVKNIFRGNVESYVDYKQGQTRVTRLTLSSAGPNARESIPTVSSWEKNTPVDTIVESLLRDMGVPIVAGGVAKLGDDVRTRKIVYMNGQTKEALWRLSKQYDADFAVIDYQSLFLPYKRVAGIIPLNDGVALSSNSGLIGDVVPNDDTSGLDTSDTKTPKRSVTFKTYLNGNLAVGYGIELDTPRYSGIFKITEIMHEGTFEGNEWYTNCKAEEVDS